MKVKYDLDFAFRHDFRLEGALDGGVDQKDFALRCGKVLESSGESCAKCGHPFVVDENVIFLVFGYEPPQYREILYCYGCLPKWNWLERKL